MTDARWRRIFLASSFALATRLVAVPVALDEATTADVLASLRSAEGAYDPDKINFEMLLGETPIGYAVYSLTDRSERKGDGYSFRVESEVLMPNGVRLRGLITSHLDAKFEPKNVEARRTVTTPDGTKQLAVDRTKIDADTVIIRREVTGEPPTRRSIACPQRPFVLAIEFLVQRIDVSRFGEFSLREFDLQDGEIIVHHFASKARGDGGLDLSSTEDDGDMGYRFTLDSKGKLLSTQEPPLPVVAKRCSQERVEELRRSLQKN